MRKLLIGLALCLVVGTAAASISSAGGPFVSTLTGCHNARVGAVYAIAVGEQPKVRCLAGDVPVSLSAGDLTKLSAGTGLKGGGDNGDVTLALDASYALPQSCVGGQVAKWSGSAWACAADQSGGSYVAGDGLELVGNAFRLKGCGNGETPRYTIPGGWTCVHVTLASQSCSPGAFAQGVTAGGLLSCGTPAGGGGVQAYFGKEVNPTQGGREEESVGMPSDDNERVYAAVVVPAGTYFVTASAELETARNVDPFKGALCRLNDYADERQWGSTVLNDDGATQSSFTLQGSVASSGGSIADLSGRLGRTRSFASSRSNLRDQGGVRHASRDDCIPSCCVRRCGFAEPRGADPLVPRRDDRQQALGCEVRSRPQLFGRHDDCEDRVDEGRPEVTQARDDRRADLHLVCAGREARDCHAVLDGEPEQAGEWGPLLPGAPVMRASHVAKVAALVVVGAEGFSRRSRN